MSIFASVSCPKCNKEELSIAIAHCFGKIRLAGECGYWAEVDITQEEEDLLNEILNKRKRR